MADGHIRLQLVHNLLTLTIPIAVVRENSVRAKPYLRFLIFVILGTLGDVEVQEVPVEAEDVDVEDVDVEVVEPPRWKKMLDDEELMDFGVYRYADIETTSDLPSLVRRDLNQKAASEFETTPSRTGQDEFAEALKTVAGCVCIFSEKSKTFCQASHIIRYSSAHFLPIIQEHRVHPANQVKDVQSSKNGLYVSSDIHKVLENFNCSVLPLPNAVMTVEDVPQKDRILRNTALMLGPPPNNMRYVLQKLKDPGYGIDEFIGEANVPAPTPTEKHTGQNAWFAAIDDAEAALPAQHLLEYHYGVAAVIAWAGNYQEARPKIPRPPAESTSIRPKSGQHGEGLRKLHHAPWRQEDQGTGGPSRSHSTESDQLEDALDFVARLRALNPENIVAREGAEQRRKDGVAEWLQTVPFVSVQ
ncbi:hypothetical protein C8F04DRAFT_1261137 [Mycena alexandri]|uniref:HNH nuclease domain-containing protein n=1 Tax=Mycena alexandri TaxID=1745969 RepID=A0AAD6SV95_9AGAR|nr:hypothetical protein C8F04DRAFT_1261137 [Mycena alexandri]